MLHSYVRYCWVPDDGSECTEIFGLDLPNLLRLPKYWGLNNFGLHFTRKSASEIFVFARPLVTLNRNSVGQRFLNFFQVGTTFISQNVLRTTLLLGLSNSLGLP